MLRTRLWMGAILVALTLGVLLADQWLAPWFPFLFVLLVALGGIACHELLHLIPEPRRPPAGLCHLGVVLLVVSNWLPHLAGVDVWRSMGGTFAAVVIAAFLIEMANFQTPGESINRIALSVWIVAYLGLLPSFLAQMRWLSPDLQQGTHALALAVFVPKCCDIGAYFTGRFLGRHKMAPVLSPKKTWEGAAGGILAAVLVTMALNRLGPVLTGGPLAEVAFGITVGGAGMLGDLAESLIKRDCQQKDASQAVPGFGGVLDVVDAVLFAAPVAYWWVV